MFLILSYMVFAVYKRILREGCHLWTYWLVTYYIVSSILEIHVLELFTKEEKKQNLDCCSFYASRVTLSSKSSKTKTLIWEFWLVAWNLLWITQDSYSEDISRVMSYVVPSYSVLEYIECFNSWISEPHPRFYQLPIEINIYIHLSCMSTWSCCYWTSLILLPRAWV